MIRFGRYIAADLFGRDHPFLCSPFSVILLMKNQTSPLPDSCPNRSTQFGRPHFIHCFCCRTQGILRGHLIDPFRDLDVIRFGRYIAADLFGRDHPFLCSPFSVILLMKNQTSPLPDSCPNRSTQFGRPHFIHCFCCRTQGILRGHLIDPFAEWFRCDWTVILGFFKCLKKPGDIHDARFAR